VRGRVVVLDGLFGDIRPEGEAAARYERQWAKSHALRPTETITKSQLGLVRVGRTRGEVAHLLAPSSGRPT
jgi:hypothetical protein